MNNIFNTIVISLLILFTFTTGSCDRKSEIIPFNFIPVESTVGNYNMLNLSDFATDINKPRGGFTSSELGSMYRFKDDVRIYKPINDTIFTISQDAKIKDAFILELGKYGPTLSYFERKEIGGDLNEMIRQRNSLSQKFIFINTIYESRNHLFFKFTFGNHAPEPFEYVGFFGNSISSEVCGVFDKFSGKLALMRQPIKGKLGFKNDIDNGPVIFPHYLSSNNELVTYISVEDFLDYYEKIDKPTPQMAEIAKNIKIDDNHIVIIAKLKE